MYQGNLFTPSARIPNYHRSFNCSVMCILNASASISFNVALVNILKQQSALARVLGLEFLGLYWDICCEATLSLGTNLKNSTESSHTSLWEHSQRKGKREMTMKRWLKTKRVGMVNLAPHHPFTHAQQRKLANLGCERHGKESLPLHAFNEAADFLEREPQDLNRKEPAE